MSTVLDSVVDAIMPGKPSRAKKRRYREAVFAGGEPPENVVMAEWRVDRSTFERIEENENRAAIELPELEQAAAEAAKAAEEARRLATGPLPGTMLLDDLRPRVVAAGYRGPCNTADEWAAGLPFLRGHSHALRTAAFKAEEQVRACLAQIAEVLRRTTRDLPPDREVLDCGRKIAVARRECEQLASGQRPPDFSSVHAPGEQPTPLSQLYKVSKKRLDSLLKLAAGKASAEEANRSDEAELRRLTAELRVAQRESLVRQTKLAKKYLRWVGGGDES